MFPSTQAVNNIGKSCAQPTLIETLDGIQKNLIDAANMLDELENLHDSAVPQQEENLSAATTPPSLPARAHHLLRMSERQADTIRRLRARIG